jgi:Ca-activated chloride channel family protein
VVLISDGEANVGVTSAATIGQASHAADDEGIYLVGVNVGAEAGDNLMTVVTDRGRGASVFIDTEAEATRMFGDGFDKTMEIAARAVRLELTVPWYMSLETFSGKGSSTDAKMIDPQHLAPNDAMVFNEVLVACSPGVGQPTDVIKARATWQTPVDHEDRADEVSITVADLLASPAPHLAKGTAIYDYASLLRQMYSVPKTQSKADLAKVLKEVQAANPGGDPDLDEIAMLLKKLDATL